jgi:hypothetical protein
MKIYTYSGGELIDEKEFIISNEFNDVYIGHVLIGFQLMNFFYKLNEVQKEKLKTYVKKMSEQNMKEILDLLQKNGSNI